LFTATPTDVRIASWHIAGAGLGALPEADRSVADLIEGIELVRDRRAQRVLVRQHAAACGDFAVMLVGGTHES
jgi:hypothetical protein